MAIIKIRNAAIDLDAAEIPNLPATKITSGTLATARLGSGTANNSTFLRGDQSYQPLSEFNDDKLVNDISTLALHQATNNNSAKYNLTNSNVDVYQDSSAIANLTNCARDNSGEYISTITGGSLNGSFTDFAEANFDGPTCWSWSGNNLTMGTTPDTDIGSHTGQGSSPIEFGANLPFQLKAGPTYNNNGYGPYHGMRLKTSTTTVIAKQSYNDDQGEFYYFHGGSNTNPGIYVNDGAGDGNDSRVYTDTSNSGQYIGYERTAGGIFKLHSSTSDNIEFDNSNNTLRYTFTNAYNGAYYFVISGQGGRISYLYNMKYDLAAAPSTSATGSYESTAQTANASVTKISAVVTYTNASGTNTLNSDIVLQVSADNGSNWSNATLTAAGTFSTGVLQAVTNDISVTAGTQLKYKISFANQASGSKVARINGVSLSY